jgi:hemoglobin-like flavoprotein
MTAREMQLVRESFFELQEVSGPLSLLFYGRLFAVEPKLRRLFSDDMAAQGNKLMEMLAAAVDGMDDWTALKPALRDMGVRHTGYGVQPAHYVLVGDAMVWSISQALSGGADPELKRAWRSLIDQVSHAMQGVESIP